MGRKRQRGDAPEPMAEAEAAALMEGDADDPQEPRAAEESEAGESEHDVLDSAASSEGEADEPARQEDEDEDEEDKKDKKDKKKKKKKKKDTKRGVVYISHPPAFMKPAKVKHLLSQYGEVTKLYMDPEDDAVRKSRKKRGGTNKVKYKEGWVEFADRKLAKTVALSLNGKPVGGNRRSFHFEDLWNLKFLPGFQWSHLTEKAAYEKRTKGARLRAELASAKRENEFYLEKVAEGKRIKAIVGRKQAREERRGGGGGGKAPEDKLEAKRSFKQLDSLDEYKSKKVKRNDGAWLSNVFS